MRSRLPAVLFTIAALVVPARAAGQLIPLSEVFPVSVPEERPDARAIALQGTPVAAALSHDFAVASLRLDGSNASIVDGVLVDLSGQPGPGFTGRILGDGAEPILQDQALAATGAGDLVLAWVAWPFSLSYRRFGRGGVPRGEVVNLAESEGHRWGLCSPSVAGNAPGGFVIAWEQCDYPGSADALSVRAFNAAGEAATAELPIALPGVAEGAGRPQVGLDAAGRFVVIWRQTGVTATDPVQLCGRAYGARGGFLGSPFCAGDLAGSTTGALAVDPSGTFLLTWFGPPGSGAAAPLILRRYQMDGTPLGPGVQIASATAPFNLAAASDLQGNAVLSWREGDRLRLLPVRRDGVAKGPVVTISGTSGGWGGPLGSASTFNGVALSSSGRVLATWPSGRSILGQLWYASGLLP